MQYYANVIGKVCVKIYTCWNKGKMIIAKAVSIVPFRYAFRTLTFLNYCEGLVSLK